MTDPADFLHAIVARPDDNATRLVFADWLEEQGDLARATLIRLQCEIVELPHWDRRAVEATWEIEAVVAQHGARWRAELPTLEGIRWTDFDRGFVSTVRVSGVRALYEHAAAIAAAAPVFCVELRAVDETEAIWSPGLVPWLTILRITGGGENKLSTKQTILGVPKELEILGLTDYGGLEWLADHTDKLTRLKVEGGHTVGLAFARQLAAAAPTGLTHLELGTLFIDWDSGYYNDPTLDVEGARALAEARLNELVTLDVSRQRVRAEGLAALLETMPLLRELGARGSEVATLDCFATPGFELGAPIVRLDVGQNPIGDAGVRVIASSPRLTNLASLELDTCEVSEVGITALTTSACWQNLQVLDLGRNPIGLAGILALTQAATPARLHTLRLADADLTPDAVSLLAGIAWLPSLRVLDLSTNALGGRGHTLFEYLASPDTLRRMSVAKTGLEPQDGAALAVLWESLIHLDASSNDLGFAGLDALITERGSRLQTLQLRSCKLDARALALLLARARCPMLRSLDLANNTFDAASIGQLLVSPLAQQLEVLDLAKCTVDNVAALFANAPALPRLHTLNLRDIPFAEADLLLLARADTLRTITNLKLSGEVWSFPVASRAELDARFGRGFHYYEDPLEQVLGGIE